MLPEVDRKPAEGLACGAAEARERNDEDLAALRTALRCGQALAPKFDDARVAAQQVGTAATTSRRGGLLGHGADESRVAS
jgi:hypothetical protein